MSQASHVDRVMKCLQQGEALGLTRVVEPSGAWYSLVAVSVPDRALFLELFQEEVG